MQVFLLGALASVTLAIPAPSNNITFDIALVPEARLDLPAFTLGSSSTLPTAFLDKTLESVSPGSKLNGFQGNNGKIAHCGEQVVGVVDPDTGGASFYPNYEALEPIFSTTGENNATYLKNYAIFPQDAPTLDAIPGPSLYSARHVRNGTPTPVPLIFHVIAQCLIPVENTTFLSSNLEALRF